MNVTSDHSDWQGHGVEMQLKSQPHRMRSADEATAASVVCLCLTETNRICTAHRLAQQFHRSKLHNAATWCTMLMYLSVYTFLYIVNEVHNNDDNLNWPVCADKHSSHLNAPMVRHDKNSLVCYDLNSCLQTGLPHLAWGYIHADQWLKVVSPHFLDWFGHVTWIIWLLPTPEFSYHIASVITPRSRYCTWYFEN